MTWILISGLLGVFSALASSTLSSINVLNAQREAKVSLSFTSSPIYAFFSLHSPERIVLDIRQKSRGFGIPLNFDGKQLLKGIRFSVPKDSRCIRLVFGLTQHAKIRVVKHRYNGVYSLVFTFTAKANDSATLMHKDRLAVNGASCFTKKSTMLIGAGANITSHRSRRMHGASGNRIVVAIDAGHGGQDPGAIGANGVKEKNVTIAIAYRLYALLNDDVQFMPVLTRNGNYFISLMGRSNVARKQNANILLSIHADAAPNRSAKGASVWVLSNRRANSEMASWIEQHEKQSELLGEAREILANKQAYPYLSKAVLDLQFCHSQRVGYDMALKVLEELHRIGSLHKFRPERASLGVLRSPDIPSVLVETGFISNIREERLLGSRVYQNKIAKAIYNGLRNYFLAYPLHANPKT